jgi:hypothetical protein
MKKQLFIDYSKWRFGSDRENKLGRGDTALLNSQGFMCCLGQFSLQLGCSKEEIKGEAEPGWIHKEIPVLTTKKKANTLFSNKAMEINDDDNTTPEEKIAALKTLLKKKGIKLIIKNKK